MKKNIFLVFLINLNFVYSYFDLTIPTRINGEKKYLKADLFSSDTNIAKPVIFIQTPYNKNEYRIFEKMNIQINPIFDTANYNFVIMDWRGFYTNKNVDSSGYNLGLDGYDVIEWIANQKWCNKKIGTWGGSALGHIQFLTAAENPPHLICAAPFIKDFKNKYEDPYYGGVFRKEHYESLEKLFQTNISLILSNPLKNNLWKAIENQNKIAEKIKVPMLLCTGWFDHYPSFIIRAFEDLQEKSDVNVRNKHKLLIGPWLHDKLGEINQGELKFQNAENENYRYGKLFLDFYLLNKNNGWDTIPNLSYFEINNIWYFSNKWTNIPRIKDTLYLNKDFKLTINPPDPLMSPLEQFPDTLISDSKKPTPTIGGSRFNPFDKNILTGPVNVNSILNNRSDVLIYETEELTNDYVINGKTDLELFFSSNREDTDLSFRLCDEYPDGSRYIISQGIKRARLRNSLSKEELLVPNQDYSITIEIDDLSYRFLIGHKICIFISSSNFPMFDLNLNNGKEMYKNGDTLDVQNLIYRTPSKSSRLIIENPKIIKTDIDLVINDNETNITPIPVTEMADISAKFTINSLNIYNYYGEEIYKIDNIFSKKTSLNLSFLPKGCYLVKVNFAHTYIIKHLIKI